MSKKRVNLSEKESIVLAAIALLPPPANIDVIVNATGYTPLCSIKVIEQLLDQRLILSYKPGGVGFYRLKEPSRARQFTQLLSQSNLHNLAKKIISQTLKENRPSEQKSLIVANVCSYCEDVLIDIDTEAISEAAYYCMQIGALEAATIYFGILVNQNPILSASHKSLFIDAALSVIRLHGHIIPLIKQREILCKAREFAAELSDDLGLFKIIMALTQIVKREGDYYAASNLNEEAWAIAHRIKNEELIKRAAFSSIDFLFWQGLIAEAISRYESTIGNLENIESDEFTLDACATLGWCYGIFGDTARGVNLLQNVRTKAKESGFQNLYLRANILIVLSLLEVRRFTEAEPFLDEILSYPEEQVGNYILWASYSAKATILWTDGHYKACYIYHTRAYEKLKEFGLPHPRGPWNLDYMDALESLNIVHPKMNYETEVKRLIEDCPDVYMRGVGLRYRAQRMIAKGKPPEEVIDDINNSIELLTKSGAKIELLRTKIVLSRIYIIQNREQDAKSLLKEVWDIFSSVNPDLFPDDLQPLLENPDYDSFFLKALTEVGNSIGTVHDRKHVLERIITLLLRLTGAGRGAYFEYGSKGPDIVASRNLDKDTLSSSEFHYYYNIIKGVCESGREIVTGINGCSHDQTVPISGWIICTPVMLRERHIGVIYLDNSLPGLQPHEKSLSLLKIISTQLAIALDNADSYEKIARVKDKMEDEALFYRNQMQVPSKDQYVIGSSDAIKKVLLDVQKVSRTSSTVLITGETGVGKELVARGIHRLSDRNNGPFIPVNSSSLDSNLITSELFGHEKGSFTGAIRRKRGRFELADGGTLFIDEIDTLPLEIQTKILRAIQEKEFQRLGSDTIEHSDFRLIAATNQNLEKLVKSGEFRSDLFYRLSVFPINIPPLRNRKEDIQPLVMHFIKHFNIQFNKAINGISKHDLEQLLAYDWPGNVRELQHVIERAVILSDGAELSLQIQPQNKQPENFSDALIPFKDVEKHYISKVLHHCNWKIAGPKGASAILKIKPSTLYARMRKLGIKRKAKEYGRNSPF